MSLSLSGPPSPYLFLSPLHPHSHPGVSHSSSPLNFSHWVSLGRMSPTFPAHPTPHAGTSGRDPWTPVPCTSLTSKPLGQLNLSVGEKSSRSLTGETEQVVREGWKLNQKDRYTGCSSKVISGWIASRTYEHRLCLGVQSERRHTVNPSKREQLGED